MRDGRQIHSPKFSLGMIFKSTRKRKKAAEANDSFVRQMLKAAVNPEHKRSSQLSFDSDKEALFAPLYFIALNLRRYVLVRLRKVGDRAGEFCGF